MPAPMATRPSARQRVCYSISHSPPNTMRPKLSSGIAPMWRIAPGQARDPVGGGGHDIDAFGHDGERELLRGPTGSAIRGEKRRRHDDQIADRDGDQVGDQRVLLAAVEVIDAKRRDGDARDHGRQHDAAMKNATGRSQPPRVCSPVRSRMAS